METHPWAAGVATGVGSLPGEDVREAARTVVGELPDFPHLPELPGRGPAAEIAGRGASFLVDLHVELWPSGWRLAGRPGVDARRAAGLVRQDLDALEEFIQGYEGPLKVQVAGPWTLAAALELAHGDKALRDPGACRDLSASLAEGVRQHVMEVRGRVPGARVVLQLDEPSLPAVLAGGVPTASGFGRLPAVDAATAADGLRRVVSAADAATVVHCCAPGVPIGLLRDAGVRGVSLDLRLRTLCPPRTPSRPSDDEALAEAVEDGIGLFLGAVPSGPPTDRTPAEAATSEPVSVPVSEPAATVERVRAWWRRLGFPVERLAETVVVTPACGLVGMSPEQSRAALARSRKAAAMLLDGA
ncbi:MAG: methionine synthase [Carbonactinosporaceae bacterium]